MSQVAGTIRQAPSPAKAIPRPRLEVMRSIGWLCVAAAGMLSILGAVAIGTVPPGPGETNLAYAHLAHLVIGLAAAVVVVIPHYRVAQKLSYPLLGVVVLMLIFVLIPWVPESIVRPRNGARRWINVVVTDFQPSELAKIAWVLALASYLRYRENYRRVLGLLLPLAITLIPMALILKEPDLGTALLFLPTLFAVLVAAGAKLRHLAAVIVIGLTLALSMYPLLEPHQKDRINAMIAQAVGDDQYINDIGFQGDRAMTLVGAGQWTGVGRTHAAAMVIYNALPEDHNDMIFAVVTCRWGVLGAVAVWGVFLVLCGGGLLIAAQCKDPFGRLVSVGLVAVLFSQMAINTGMTIGIMPITGMTLPFVSAGGSSLVSAWIMVGLLVNIAMRRQRYLAKEAFDFDGRDEA